MNTTLLCALALLLQAQEADAQDPIGDSTEPVDEVTVYADETIPRLRAKLRRLDEAFFTRYNDINENDELDMICKRQSKPGSQIVYTICESRLHRELRSEDAMEFLDGDGTVSRVNAGWKRKHYKKVRANINEVMSGDDKLQGLLKERAEMRAEINRRKKAK